MRPGVPICLENLDQGSDTEDHGVCCELWERHMARLCFAAPPTGLSLSPWLHYLLEDGRSQCGKNQGRNIPYRGSGSAKALGQKDLPTMRKSTIRKTCLFGMLPAFHL
uniref:Uncharacterized protein n=1 Tax=Myotis myotis TaxID=51298 RepID=A0A7J7VYS3_MYOMY|nr:hypothetical protein mMyoMyo1_012250 [Myotis myotis]